MNAWTIYVIFSLLLCLLADYLLFRRLSTPVRISLGISVIVVLMMPTAVPDTQSLAPAWFVACFELVFGSIDIARKAITPLIGLLLVIQVVFLAYRLLRYRRGTVES